MNIRTGLLRLWVVATLIWVPAIIVTNWTNIRQDEAWAPQPRLDNNPFAQLPVPCTDARGVKGEDYIVRDAAEPWNRYRNTLGACWYTQNHLRELYPEYADVPYAALRGRLYEQLGWEQAAERGNLENTTTAALRALLPPLGVLLLAYLVMWVFAGFRRPSTS